MERPSTPGREAVTTPALLPRRLLGVVFDFDGTVADTLRLVISGFQEAVASVGGPTLSDREVPAFFGPTEAGMLRRAVGDRWPAAYRTYLHAYERDHAPYDNLFHGIPEIIALLKSRGVRVGLVTGKGRESALISVARTGLDAWLDAFETGSDEGLAKAAGIGRVLASWGVDPAHAAYVGDTPDDMHSAVEAGVVALGAAWALTASVVPGPGWTVVPTVAELARILDAATT
jgi:phosphoglycolate phosphatase-like HAD superfamily hydrolase